MRGLMICAYLALGLTLPLQAQTLDDPRLDPDVRFWIEMQEEVPVMVTVMGPRGDVRNHFRLLNRALAADGGRIEGTPDQTRSFLARVNRFGLLVLLSFEQVEAIRPPFEMRFPGDLPSID